jgi:hypothetical protein
MMCRWQFQVAIGDSVPKLFPFGPPVVRKNSIRKVCRRRNIVTLRPGGVFAEQKGLCLVTIQNAPGTVRPQERSTPKIVADCAASSI